MRRSHQRFARSRWRAHRRHRVSGRVVRDLQSVGVDDDRQRQGQDACGRGNTDTGIPRHGDREARPRRRSPHRATHGLRRRARSADTRQMRDPPLAHAARRVQFRREHVDRGRRQPDACADRQRLNLDREMPKIAEIEGTPNPNALKFVLKEPLTWGIKRSYDNPEEAKDDALAAALFDIGHVTNVFYIDHWLTVTQDGGADWQELTRKIAEPLRAAPAASAQSTATVAAATTVIADLSPEDQQRLDMINALLDEHIRPYLQGDGGDLYVIGLEGNRLAVHYQGACGSCPSSISGTLQGIENLVKSIEPDIEVFAV